MHNGYYLLNRCRSLYENERLVFVFVQRKPFQNTHRRES